MNQKNYFDLATFQRNFHVILDNVNNEPIIAHRLQPFGYDATHLAEGMTLLNELAELDSAQSRAYGEKEAAKAEIDALFDELDSRYGWHRGLAKRLLSKGSNGRRALRLNERKARTRDRWLRQARVFYSNLLSLPEIQTTFAKYGQTESVLLEMQAQVEQLGQLVGHQARCKALAEEATRNRNLKWKAARAWLAILLDTAKEALREEPQLLEAFQFVAPSPTMAELIAEETLDLGPDFEIAPPEPTPNETTEMDQA